MGYHSDKEISAMKGKERKEGWERYTERCEWEERERQNHGTYFGKLAPRILLAYSLRYF